jgi:hypothetical protein
MLRSVLLVVQCIEDQCVQRSQHIYSGKCGTSERRAVIMLVFLVLVVHYHSVTDNSTTEYASVYY